MKFEDFEQVAAILRVINPATADHDLDAHMQAFAYMLQREGHTTGGTLGYFITLFKPTWSVDTIARATLTPYSVQKYIDTHS